MLLGLIIILLIGVIAFWHFMQGLFSATLSAILVIVSALLAFSFTEPVVNMFKPGKYADSANGMILCALFAVIYLVLRLAFDILVPGNMRFQSTIDKAGGAVMGVVAGIFAMGVVVVAAQALPFGPSIAGYSRYALGPDRPVTPKSATGMGLDRVVSGEMKSDKFTGESPSSPIVPVDSMLVGLVKLVSNGSLSTELPLDSIHPDYLQELFGQRLGLEAGAKHSAPNYPGETPMVTVTGVYTLPQIEQRDGELESIRMYDESHPKVPKTLKPEAGQALLVVRTIFSHDAGDADNIFRFSTGNCRLVVHHQSGSPKYTDSYPIGTLESAQRLYVNHLDDPLFVDVKGTDQGADLVFLIDNADDLITKADDKKLVLADQTFLEVKHLGLVDLAGVHVDPHIAAALNIAVMRKHAIQPMALKSVLDEATVKSMPLTNLVVGVRSMLPQELSVGTTDPNGNINQTSLTGSLKDKKINEIRITATDNVDKLKTGATLIEDLLVPPGKRMIQVRGVPQGDDPWAWTDLSKFELVDDAGIAVHPTGGWCYVKQGDETKMVGQYVVDQGVPTISKQDGATPTQVWIAFIVPAKVGLTELRYGGKAVKDLRDMNATSP